MRYAALVTLSDAELDRMIALADDWPRRTMAAKGRGMEIIAGKVPRPVALALLEVDIQWWAPNPIGHDAEVHAHQREALRGLEQSIHAFVDGQSSNGN